jgi:hypothetical protein
MYDLFGAYLNQDFDLWGDTLEEIVGCYKRDSLPEHHREIIGEIDLFVTEHPMDLDSAFKRGYRTGFDPVLWGYTITSFFEELKKLLSK